MIQTNKLPTSNVMEWNEGRVTELLKAVLLFGSMDYVQKIKLDNGFNVYVVSEKLYQNVCINGAQKQV